MIDIIWRLTELNCENASPYWLRIAIDKRYDDLCQYLAEQEFGYESASYYVMKLFIELTCGDHAEYALIEVLGKLDTHGYAAEFAYYWPPKFITEAEGE